MKPVLILTMLIHMSVSDGEKSDKYERRAVEMLIVLKSSRNLGKSSKKLVSLLR